MQTFNTREVVKVFATNCVNWIVSNNLIEAFNHHGRMADRWCNPKGVSLSLESFREYLDSVLSKLVDGNTDNDIEVDLGHYVLVSEKSKSYIVVKRSKRQLPKLPSSYVDWVNWDIPKGHASNLTHNICTNHVYKGAWNNSTASLSDRIRLIHVSILSQVLLQCLFNLDGSVDLSMKPLPSQDLRCRVGNYELLYDHLMQEWRIWKKM